MTTRFAYLLATAACAATALLGCGSDASSDDQPCVGCNGVDASAQETSVDSGRDAIADSATPDQGVGDASNETVSDTAIEATTDVSEGGSPDADDAMADASDGDAQPGDHHTSLSVCWIEPDCHRAMIIAHGGQWGAQVPFLSARAFQAAYETGADGIEADVHVTMDGVAVVAHSSPIEVWESLDCQGERIEEMTADEVTSCHLAPSLTDTFQRVDDVIDWAQGKLIMEWDVKETADLAPTIQLILQKGAADRNTILVGRDELATTLPTITGWDQLHYIADIGSGAEIQPAIAEAQQSHVFMFELDRSYGDATEQQVADFISQAVHPAGIKAFGASDQYLATVQNHLDVFHQGFDAVLSYNVPNGIQAATQINVERGYGP